MKLLPSLFSPVPLIPVSDMAQLELGIEVLGNFQGERASGVLKEHTFTAFSTTSQSFTACQPYLCRILMERYQKALGDSVGKLGQQWKEH